MIRELSNKPQTGNPQSNTKSRYTKVKNELNIKIPGYLVEKNSEYKLNKSNLNDNKEKRIPLTTQERSRTKGKDKNKLEKLHSSTDGIEISSIGYEKTLDTTNPKHTHLKDRSNSKTYTNNNFNTSPNNKYDNSNIETLSKTHTKENEKLNNSTNLKINSSKYSKEKSEVDGYYQKTHSMSNLKKSIDTGSRKTKTCRPRSSKSANNVSFKKNSSTISNDLTESRNFQENGKIIFLNKI